MTHEEAVKFYEKLKEYYNGALVNYECYPKIFAYQVKMFKYYKGNQ